MRYGIHATPNKYAANLEKKGLKSQWVFGRSFRRFIRSPKPSKFRWKYFPNVHEITDASPKDLDIHVRNSLKMATRHVTGSSRSRIDVGGLSLYLVDLEKANIMGHSSVKSSMEKELLVESGPDALRRVEFTESEIKEMEKAAGGLEDDEANERISRIVSEKVGRIIG